MPAMKKPPTQLSDSDWVKLILGITIFLGLLVRIFPALIVGFPLNDGGMFLVMIRDLIANGFRLPAFTTYNLSNIPYAYPPLGFYLAGMLSALGIPDIEVLRWLPIFLNFASIPAFFVLARALLKDELKAALATMVYAMVPGNFAWQIMGGGVTRALGILFILLALYQVLQMFRSGRWKHAWLSMLFCSLAVLSHPEVSLATATGCGLFWAFFGRTRRGTLQAALVAIGTVVLTAPWWGSVLAYHGLTPFEAVLHSGAYNSNPLKTLITDLFNFDPWAGIFHLIFLCGLAWSLYKKQWFLPAWLLLPYLVEPRSAPAFAYLPEAMLAAIAIADAGPAILRRLSHKNMVDGAPTSLSQSKGANVVAMGLLMLWFVQGALYGFRIVNTSLRPPIPQRVMAWAGANTPLESEFIIVTGIPGIMTDPLQEWFPAFALRNSRSTLQGLEWTLGEQFFPRLKQLAALQECKQASCLEGWSESTGLSYNHVLLEKNAETEPLLGTLRGDANYKLLYEEGSYLIFAR
jgi:hypothetical protein